MESLYDIKDALCERLDEIADEIQKKGGLPDNCIEMTDLLTHSLKSVVTTIAMCEGGYSEDGGGYSGRNSYGNASMSDGSSYGGGDGYSGRRGRSRTTGRFVSRDGGNGGGMSGRRGRYSMDDAESGMMSEIDAIIHDTNDGAVRQRLTELKKRMGGGQ